MDCFISVSLLLLLALVSVHKFLIARRNGEGRYKDVGPVMIQGGTFLLGLAVLMFGLTHLLAPSVVRLLISSDSIFDATMNSSTGVSLVFSSLLST